jgi:hypothetical protein
VKQIPFVLSLSKHRLLVSSFDIDPPGDRTNGKGVLLSSNIIPLSGVIPDSAARGLAPVPTMSKSQP